MLHKAWNSKGEMPYRFPRSSVKFQGHTVQNITDFDPNWAFPDERPVAAFKSLRFALFYEQFSSISLVNLHVFISFKFSIFWQPWGWLKEKIISTSLIFRFYFQTDPKNADYELEDGATRNFEALRTAELQAKKEAEELEAEEANNPMKVGCYGVTWWSLN